MGHRKLRRAEVVTIGSFLLLGLMGCLHGTNVNSATATPQPTQSPQQVAMQKPSAVDPKLVTANTKFGFKLFSEVLKQDGKQNVFVSPSSVAIALAMTYNGASGATQQQMAKALELRGMSLSQLNRARLCGP
jgi:serpin B